MPKIDPRYKTSTFLVLFLLIMVFLLCILALVSMNPAKMLPPTVLKPAVQPLVGSQVESQNAEPVSSPPDSELISGSFDPSKFKTEAQWKAILTPDEFTVLREAGTETPFTGALLHESRKGTYYSVGCDEPVFRSEQKFDSGTGWPSFWAPINKDALVLKNDTSIPGEPRVEVLDKCGNHLGHLFDDGPQPTGERYCMNSVALKFVPDAKQ